MAGSERLGSEIEARLRDYLDRNAATMPRTALRYAIEHLPADTRNYYLKPQEDRTERTLTRVRERASLVAPLGIDHWRPLLR